MKIIYLTSSSTNCDAAVHLQQFTQYSDSEIEVQAQQRPEALAHIQEYSDSEIEVQAQHPLAVCNLHAEV